MYNPACSFRSRFAQFLTVFLVATTGGMFSPSTLAQALRQLALSIEEEERREGDGCLRRLEQRGTLPPTLPRTGAAVGVAGGDLLRAGFRSRRRW